MAATKSTHNIQIGIIAIFVFFFNRIQRCVVINRWLVGWVIIVTEKIEPIQIFVQFWHVIALFNVLETGWNGHRQQKSGTSGFVVFSLEFFTKFLNQLGVVFTILWFSTVTMRGIFCGKNILRWKTIGYGDYATMNILPQSKSRPSNLFWRKNLMVFLTSWLLRSELATKGENLVDASFQPVIKIIQERTRSYF